MYSHSIPLLIQDIQEQGSYQTIPLHEPSIGFVLNIKVQYDAKEVSSLKPAFVLQNEELV